MHTIKVSAIDSTNTFLRELHQKRLFTQNICLVAQNQTKGRGQRGADWVSEPGKNLTFSLLLRDLKLPVKQHFKLNAAVSLGLIKALKSFFHENLSIKWPNDILSGNHKIAGILIENVIKNRYIQDTIVGIGLNVNQEKFVELPNAASLKSISGKDFELESLLPHLSAEIESSVLNCIDSSMEEILKKYHHHLFRKGEFSDFELPSGEVFSGLIIGVSHEGKLVIDTQNGKKEFMLKEVKMNY